MEEDNNMYTIPGNEEPEVEKQGKGPRKFLKILIPIAAVLVVVAAAVLILINPKVQNAIKKNTLSDEKYYQYIEKRYIVDQAAQNAADFYGSYIATGKKSGLSGSFKLTLGDDFSDVLSSFLESSVDGDLSKFKNVTLAYTYNPDSENKRIGYSATLSYNGDKLLPVEAIIDLKKEEVYLNITNLSDQFLYTDLSEIFGEKQLVDIEQILGAAAASKDLPDQKLLYKVVDKYLNIIIGQFTDVDRDDDYSISKGDVEMDVIRMTITIDNDLVKDIIDAVCEEAEDDKDLFKLIAGLSELAGEDMDEDDAEDAVAELIKELEDAEPDMEKPITMYVYVDKDGNVVGREIEVENGTIGIYSLDDGKNVYCGFEMNSEVDEDDYEYSYKASNVTKFILQGKKKSGKVNGTLECYYKNYSEIIYKEWGYSGVQDVDGGITLEVSNFDLAKFKKGEISGTFAINSKTAFTGDMKEGYDDALDSLLKNIDSSIARYLKNWLKDWEVALTLDISDKNFDVKLAISSDDDLLLEVATENKRVASKSIDKVSKKTDDLEEWIEDANWSSFIKTLKKSDLSSGFVDTLEELIEDLRDNGGFR